MKEMKITIFCVGKSKTKKMFISAQEKSKGEWGAEEGVSERRKHLKTVERGSFYQASSERDSRKEGLRKEICPKVRKGQNQRV